MKKSEKKTRMRHKELGDSMQKCLFVISSLPSRLLECSVSITHSHLSLSQIHPLWQNLLVKGHLEEKEIEIGILKSNWVIRIVIWQNEPADVLGLPPVPLEGLAPVCITAANRKNWIWVVLLIGWNSLACNNTRSKFSTYFTLQP